MTNRKEVAERLRMYDTDFDFGDSNPLWYVEKAVFNDIRIRESGRVFARLADLIDPTCKVENAGEVPLAKESLTTWFCSECGSPIYNDMQPSYCIYCGARVVSDDDMKEPKTVEEQTVLPSSDYVDNQTLALAT